MSISALCEHEAASDLRQAVTTIATVGRLLTSTIWYLSSAGNLGSSRLSSVERTIKMCVIPRFVSLPNAHSRFRDAHAAQAQGQDAGHSLFSILCRTIWSKEDSRQDLFRCRPARSQ